VHSARRAHKIFLGVCFDADNPGIQDLDPEPLGIGQDSEVDAMIVLGLILLVVGFFTGISILTTLGVILLVIGVIMAILGASGKAVGGRAHWY